MTTPSCFFARFALLNVLFCLTSCSSSPVAEQSASSAIPESAIDRIFDDVMQRYQLPGMALGVIVDGKVVYTRTAGESLAGSNPKINEDTLFKIASNSKA